MLRSILVITVLALLAAACSVTTEQRIVVYEDETVDFAVDVSINLPIDPAMMGDDVDVGDMADELTDDIAEVAERVGADDHTVELGDGLDMSIGLSGVPFDEVDNIYDGDDVATLLPDVSLVKDGDDIEFASTLASTDEVMVDEFADELDGPDQPGLDDDVGDFDFGEGFDEFMDASFDVDVTLAVVMPGEVTDHNADDVIEGDESTELVWHAGADERQVHATATLGGTNWLLLGGIAAAVVVVVAAGALVIARRRSR